MKDKVINTEWKQKIRVYAYQSKIFELSNSNIPLLCQSGYRGFTGISRQLHPLKAKRLKLDKIGLSSLGFQMCHLISVRREVHLFVCP